MRADPWRWSPNIGGLSAVTTLTTHDAVHGVGAKWKKHCETANFLVTYTKKDTGGLLNGEEARELSSRNYGTDEWWLLLTGSS